MHILILSAVLTVFSVSGYAQETCGIASDARLVARDGNVQMTEVVGNTAHIMWERIGDNSAEYFVSDSHYMDHKVVTASGKSLVVSYGSEELHCTKFTLSDCQTYKCIRITR